MITPAWTSVDTTVKSRKGFNYPAFIVMAIKKKTKKV